MVINIFGREIVLEIKEKRKQGGNNGKKRKKFSFPFYACYFCISNFWYNYRISRLQRDYKIGSVAQSDINCL